MPSCLPSLWPAGWLAGQKNLQSIDLESSSNYLLRERFREFFQGVVDFAAIAVIYLVSELLIWGLSLALAPAQLEFLSSVFGMLISFGIMILICFLIPNCNILYQRYIKSKIDFINRHMSVAFAIPMVMLNGGTPMDATTIGLIIGIFVATTLVAWTTVFLLARLALFLVNTLSKQISKRLYSASSQTETEKLGNNPSQQTNAFTSDAAIFNNFALQRQPLLWTWLCQFWPLIASFLSIFAIGVPLSLVLDDPRVLDGSVLWFIWMTAITVQRTMKQQAKTRTKPPTILAVFTTLANPVLITILLMTAYARARAYTLSTSISYILDRLSSGVQVYTLWTASVQHTSDGASLSAWFGAGDAALSLLGCGFVVWGFKLYECRRQLFSTSGLVTVLVSVAAAAANVYLSTYAAFLMGLSRAEALAFAARMTTLALAIPAMKNIGGNTSLTVALMITSGILGQLAYPSSLHGVDNQDGNRGRLKRNPSTDSNCSDRSGPEGILTPSTTTSIQKRHVAKDVVVEDDANTVAAGIAIGINGAAMGVAYLYENKSRSAPYAALAMTTYGVVTVVFIAVTPFKEALLSLVSRA